MSRTLLLLLAVLSVASRSVADETLRVGAAAEVITPPAGSPMAGGYSPRTMEGVNDDLYAKAIVIERDGVKVALVVCDLLGMPRPIAQAARELIAESPGIAADHVMISATHTHTGPIILNDSARDPRDGDAADKSRAYAAGLPERIAAAVRAADAKLAPARISTATGREDGLSFNRRYVMADGSVAWNPGTVNPQIVRPTGPIDPAVPVVSFDSVEGSKTLATYVNFAMHLDTTGGTRISADFPHALAGVLGRLKGPEMVTVFAAGACGDINHIDVNSPEPQSGVDEATRIGTRLAGEVIKASAKLKPVSTGLLRAKAAVVQLPVPEVTPEQFDAAKATFMKIGKERTAFMDRVQAYKTLDVAARKGKPIEVEVQVVALGNDLAWVGLPGEMFVELGLAVKRQSPFKQTIVVELANAYPGYIPTKRAYAEGAYEVISSRCAEGSGELLVDAAVKLLGEVKPRP
jgi:neutral ceramidase